MALEKNFVSEIDTFISDILKKKPELVEEQKKLRHTWWDRGFQDQTDHKALLEGEISKPGYAYFDYSNEIKHAKK